MMAKYLKKCEGSEGSVLERPMPKEVVCPVCKIVVSVSYAKGAKGEVSWITSHVREVELTPPEGSM